MEKHDPPDNVVDVFRRVVHIFQAAFRFFSTRVCNPQPHNYPTKATGNHEVVLKKGGFLDIEAATLSNSTSGDSTSGDSKGGDSTSTPGPEFNWDQTLPNQIKMVIWDLDDTFWAGTLSEGGIRILPENVQIVKTLAERGIVSSISSKNNFVDAQRALEDAGIWSYFVFPKIEFTAKGVLIAAIIDQANLRPDNVLFLDDNHLNLKEAAHFAPNLMVAHPDSVLSGLLDRPQARGKSDVALGRLAQYKQLERKVRDWTATSDSNETFLRDCDIRVKLDYDVDASFDRVVELITRANQLNFTKKRVDTASGIAGLRASLNRRDAHAGIVSVSDKYGDYGIVGFFLVIQEAGIHELEHFVFSCRAMNMGVEQFIYERLGQPQVAIVAPVANSLKSFDKVDWIRLGGEEDAQRSGISDEKLVLIGGCDLLQVASYCSTDRAEHVNTVRNGVIIRYDDYGFILNAREKLRQSELLRKIPSWQTGEAMAFDADLAEARTVIVSLWVAMRGAHLVTKDGVVVRVHPQGLGDFIDENPGQAFLRDCRFIQLDLEQNGELLRRSLDRIASLSPHANLRVILGANTRRCNGEASGLDRQNGKLYNDVAKAYAAASRLYEFISVDDAVPADHLIDDWHFTRMGYHKIATEVLALKKSAHRPPAPGPATNFDLASYVAGSTAVSRSAGVGSTFGFKGWVKRTIRSILSAATFLAGCDGPLSLFVERTNELSTLAGCPRSSHHKGVILSGAQRSRRICGLFELAPSPFSNNYVMISETPH